MKKENDTMKKILYAIGCIVSVASACLCLFLPAYMFGVEGDVSEMMFLFGVVGSALGVWLSIQTYNWFAPKIGLPKILSRYDVSMAEEVLGADVIEGFRRVKLALDGKLEEMESGLSDKR